MSTPLDEFARARTRGADLLDALADVVEPLPGGALDAEDAARILPADYLRSTARRAREGRFVVLLLGCFSSGKSTLLNALLGQPVLPVKVNPCTAILTEVVYGAEPSVRIVGSDGSVEDLGIEAFVEAYQLRTSSWTDAGAEASDRFGRIDRAIVSWPLHLLKNGVVLLDTPGLDDDELRTARTLASLPDADAVIVVLSATRFLTDLEQRTLRRNLLPLGLQNLFFPVTMVDLLDDLTDDPEHELAELHRRGREALEGLCQVHGEDRFGDRFFPLDARGGLRARHDGTAPRDPPDAEALAASGLPPFEEALGRFLVDERGQVQLRHLHATAVRIRAELAAQAEIDRATAEQSVDELVRRQDGLAPRFAELDGIARRIERTVDDFVARQRVLVWQDLRDFVARTELELPDATADFDLGGLASLDLLTARGRARVEAQLRQELETWLDARIAAWQQALKPRIERSLRQLRTELAGDAADFDSLSDRIVTDFAGGAIALPHMRTEDDEVVDPVERWFSVAMGAVLLSPGAMAAGWSEGYEGALKGAASRLGVRVALLAAGALLGPVGWAGLVLYAVSDAVLLVLTGGSQLKRLRDQVAERLDGQLVAQADATRADIEERVAQGFEPLREGLVAAARAEADELRGLLERTVAARQQAARDAAARQHQWEDALGRCDQVIAELAALTG